MKRKKNLYVESETVAVPSVTNGGQCETAASLPNVSFLLVAARSFHLLASIYFITHAAADLIACTSCCHLKGISCHTPN